MKEPNMKKLIFASVLLATGANAQTYDQCAAWGAVRGTPQYIQCQITLAQMQAQQQLQQRAIAQQNFSEGLNRLACGLSGRC
jgi:hypothetical protein